MLRTNGYILLVFFLYVILTAPVFCFADSSLDLVIPVSSNVIPASSTVIPVASNVIPAPPTVIPAKAGIQDRINSRDAIIQKQMDCVSRNLKSTGVDWQNLCYMPQAATQDQGEKAEAVNSQLDKIEDSLPNAPASQETQTETNQAVSSGVKVERQSAVGMFKGIFTQGVSPNPGPKILSDVKTRVHTFDAGAEVLYYQYQEPYLDKISGSMYGYYADYAYRPAAPNFFNNFLTNVYFLQARFATSRDLEYKGSGTVKGKHDDVDELRGLIGKDYFIGTDSMVTPYFGFGYRYLYDRGNGQITSSGAWLYDRKSHYYYLPLGCNAVIDMPNNWEVDPNIEYDIFLQGWQKTYLSDVDQFAGANFSDITNRQDHGFGIRASVKFLKRGSVVDFYVEPYIRYWNIEQSKLGYLVVNGVPVQYGWGEPDNNTVEVGSRFGIQF